MVYYRTMPLYENIPLSVSHNIRAMDHVAAQLIITEYIYVKTIAFFPFWLLSLDKTCAIHVEGIYYNALSHLTFIIILEFY